MKDIELALISITSRYSPTRPRDRMIGGEIAPVSRDYYARKLIEAEPAGFWNPDLTPTFWQIKEAKKLWGSQKPSAPAFRIVTDMDDPNYYYYRDPEPITYIAEPTPDPILDVFPLLPAYLQALVRYEQRANKRLGQYTKTHPEIFPEFDEEMIADLNKFSKWARGEQD